MEIYQDQPDVSRIHGVEFICADELPKPQPITLKFALRQFLSSRAGIVSPSTMRGNRQYLEHLARFIGPERDVQSITLEDLRQWQLSLVERTEKYGGGSKRPKVEGKLSIYTIHGMLRMTKQFFKWLYEENRIKANISDRLRLPPLPDTDPKAISEEDAAKVLTVAQAAPRNYAFIQFLYATGCRLTGAVDLRLGDLNLERGRAVVREKGKGGSGKSRVVFLSPECVQAMREWLAFREKLHPQHDFVFTTMPNDAGLGGSERITRHTVYAFMERAARRAGVTKNFHPHAWRHAFAIRLTLKGVPLGVLSKLMGHNDTKITAQFYARLQVDELQDQYDRYV